MPEDHKTYITITKGMRGYFAVMVWWNNKDNDGKGFWEPWQTGIGNYKWPEQAETEARDWADSEGIAFVPINK